MPIGCLSQASCADTLLTPAPTVAIKPLDPVDERTLEEQKQLNHAFSLLMYRPNYLLPLTVSSEHSNIESSNTPDDQSLQHEEVSFQFSFKVPLWENLGGKKNTLYVAYTQLSFWQAYNKSPFFRETNYEPEIFLANTIDKALFDGWQSQFVNVGLVHQSNGRGGDDERSWNRLYVEAIFSRNNWMLSIEPWYVIPDASVQEHNADIAHYLGHGQVVSAYKWNKQTFSLSGYGIENGVNRTTGTVTWSFPLVNQVSGYLQAFSGYGQSLIEYDHHINSFGIGVSLSDWI